MEQLILNKNKADSISKSFVTDILLLIVIYYIPTISHFLAFPLYMLDPMRIVLFGSILLSRSKVNSFFLAATIPLFSYFVGGHPVFVKSLIISIELIANAALFWLFLKNNVKVFVATFSSVVLSKLLYYVLKTVVIDAGLIEMELFSTSIIIQIVVALSISIIMTLVIKKRTLKS